jgi:hypothetical protein
MGCVCVVEKCGEWEGRSSAGAREGRFPVGGCGGIVVFGLCRVFGFRVSWCGGVELRMFCLRPVREDGLLM